MANGKMLAERHRRTAVLVSACYDTYISGRQASADQLYSLCKLTWVTGKGKADSTSSVVAPALSEICGQEISARARGELPAQLATTRLPKIVLDALRKPVGMVALYSAYRNTARNWVSDNRRPVAQVMRAAREAKSDTAARKVFEMVERLPAIHRNGGGPMPPANLLTPVLACLDRRVRTPIINARSKKETLKLLGLHRADLISQYDAMVKLIGLPGLEDAFALDVAGGKGVATHLPKAGQTGARKRRGKLKDGPASSALTIRRDEDLDYLQRRATIRMMQLHNRMTNALAGICRNRGLHVEQGTRPDSKYDALVKSYLGSRDLLIEVKTDVGQPTCRLAVGQLLDYHRSLPERLWTDRAVLFPERPPDAAQSFLDDVGVLWIWFTPGFKNIAGLPPNNSFQPTARFARGG